MRIASFVALATLTVATPAMADTAPGFETFKWEVTRLMTSGSNGGEWIAMLPTVADNCGMKINRGQLQNVASRFPDQLHTSVVADRMAHGFPNPFQHNWSIMFSEKPDRACAAIDEMWGEDGDMFPGVLRK